MLSATKEPRCNQAFWWRTENGGRSFRSLVRQYTVLDPTEEEVCEAIQRATVITGADDSFVERRIQEEAKSLATRIVASQVKANEFSDFMTKPQPARHSVQYAKGEEERGRGMEGTIQGVGRFHERYLNNLRGHRASGSAARKSAGIPQEW